MSDRVLRWKLWDSKPVEPKTETKQQVVKPIRNHRDMAYVIDWIMNGICVGLVLLLAYLCVRSARNQGLLHTHVWDLILSWKGDEVSSAAWECKVCHSVKEMTEEEFEKVCNSVNEFKSTLKGP